MSYERLAYDDQDTTLKMHTDCTACVSAMAPRTISLDALAPAPSIEYADFPREVRKPEITVSEAAAHLASRMHLHY
jgi:hypothetical protein